MKLNPCQILLLNCEYYLAIFKIMLTVHHVIVRFKSILSMANNDYVYFKLQYHYLQEMLPYCFGLKAPSKQSSQLCSSASNVKYSTLSTVYSGIAKFTLSCDVLLL